MSSRPPSSERRPNRLAGQTSPYLLQHLYNPVDWRPWGPEALAEARRDDKPIFLSIGYAACHWCHVMERESFEDAGVAAFLNERFVPIKVDREERPDLDEIYMHAVQMMIGQGGWPLNLFLTPSLEPFFGGTYFPPDERWGRASFRTVLERVDEAWRGRRGEVETSANRLAVAVASLGALEAPLPATRPAGLTESARAAAELTSRFDPDWGGFGGAPKFPPHGALQLLLREHFRSGDPAPLQMVETTLERMAGGGMYDQIGGGFARYSVDERWLVPHFEKMLYDQALLVPVYVEAWKLTRRPLYRRVVEETLDFVRRELTHADGGFFSSLDADSEGEEGKFYVWTPQAVTAELGPDDGKLFCEIYGIEARGNFEGHSIANLLQSSLAERAAHMGTTEDELATRLAPLRARLLAARERRVRPGTDDKVLTAWNGLMITAFARGYQAFGRSEDLEAAKRAAAFVGERLTAGERLLVSWREGRGQLNAYLDDHAFFARGLLDLYESSFDRANLDEAARIARLTIEHFSVPEGGFYFTANDHEALLARTISLHDGALPAGSGVMCETLTRLALHLEDESLRTPAIATLRALRPYVERAPSAFAALLAAAELLEGAPVEIVIAGTPDDPKTREMFTTAWRNFLPARVIAAAPPGSDLDLPLLRGRVKTATHPTTWVCRGSVCSAPLHDGDGLARELGVR